METAAPRRASWTPYLVLGVSLLVTLAATWHVADTVHTEERLGFERLLQRTRGAIEKRMETYIAFLRATRGLFGAAELVTRQDFRVFVNPAELQGTYPGIQGVGVGQRVFENGKGALIAAMRKEIPDFRVWPEGQRDEYEPVIYLEPQDSRNQIVMGYDMLSEAVRRSAMERARDTGLPSSTDRITLVYDVGSKQAGFIIYVSRYRHGMPTETVGDRRAALEGFVYGAFRADDLLQAIFAGEKRPGIRYDVFAGPEPKPEALLHSEPNGPGAGTKSLTGRASFEVAGSTWTLSMTAVPGFDAGSGPNRIALFLVTGLIVSGALFAVTRAEVKARAAAERAATDLRRAATQQRRLEEQLVQSQKMEGIGRLAGGVAHDFNNLLTAILGYAELMEPQLEDEGLRSELREIRLAGERAAALTRQLLAFSRRQVMQPRTLDLNTIVSDVEKMLARLIGEDVTLVTRLDPALGSVEADPGQLEQVLMNLSVNARDAMPEGGTLTFETANAVLDADFAAVHPGALPGAYVVLTVTDSGTGMTDEVRGHAFEPFFTTKEKGKGTGLGLATAYGIVKQSGGYITVDSEAGHGSTFRIYLPRVEGTAVVSGRTTISSLLPVGTETILLVEDEAGVRRLSLTVLETQGYVVLEAPSGDVALQVARSETGPIHLVVTDVVMPGMNGRELWDRLKVLRPDSRVLFMSGYTDDAIARHGVLEPGIAFLQKPFTPFSLAQKVREVLDAPAKADA
ncbi:MAG: CHASE domain-containing protein [Thermoanaerobaculia bacterium]